MTTADLNSAPPPPDGFDPVAEHPSPGAFWPEPKISTAGVVEASPRDIGTFGTSELAIESDGDGDDGSLPSPEPVGGGDAMTPLEGAEPAPDAPVRPGRVGWLRAFAIAVVAAVIGAAVGAGVVSQTSSDSTRTVVQVQRGPNTSVVARPSDIQGILAKVEPAVVAIRTGGAAGLGLFPDSGSDTDGLNEGGAGTGFVIDSNGIIATNSHVVEGADGRIEVSFPDGTNYRATILGQDPATDLAVLKIDATGIPVAELGDSSKLVVGDDVVAIGNALALDGGLSVTRGIVSATGRVVPEEGGAVLGNMLQTDAAINPGNSGGPLVNSNGQVIGINTAIAGQSQNIGFAIPISSAKPLLDALAKGQAAKTAYLGVQTQTLTAAIANELDTSALSGVVLVEVEKGGPADQVGLEKGDVLVSLDGKLVKSAAELVVAVRSHQPGDEVAIKFYRGDEQRDANATLVQRPDSNN